VWLGIYVTNKFKICVACSQLYIHLFIITNRKAYVAQGIYYMMNENKAINNCYKMSCAFLSVSLLEYYIINLTQNQFKKIVRDRSFAFILTCSS